MAKQIFKILQREHCDIVKVYTTIFKHAWND